MTSEDAEHAIRAAMQDQLRKMYGDKIFDARIYVEKIYTVEDEQADELLTSYQLSPDEYAFEVRYELLPVEGADIAERAEEDQRGAPVRAARRLSAPAPKAAD